MSEKLETRRSLKQPLSSIMAKLRGTRQPFFTHPLAAEKTSNDHLVGFDGPNDPYCAQNWPARRKRTALILYALTAAGSAFNSAILESATAQLSQDYNVNPTVSSLVTTLNLLGIALGPLLWGPLSELYGRKWTILTPFLVASFFAFGCGAAENFQTILVTRFFQGLFSGGVITNAGGGLSDMYNAKERGGALVVYSLSAVGGPLLAPIIGSTIVTSDLTWRWTMYIVGIFQVTLSILAMLILSETYAPVLLVRKAQQLRLSTGNYALHAKHEEWDISFQQMAHKYLYRPFQLLGTPVCFLMCFYASFVFGLLYGSLSAIPIVFEQHRGWGPVTGSLPFLALLLGSVLGLLANTLNGRVYAKAVDANGGKPVPEARLYPMMIGSFFMVAGLFVFAWTSTLHVIWVVPCIGLFLIGLGFFPIFQACLNYIVDAFSATAASAIAAATFTRSIFAAAFPLFMKPMLRAMGVSWGVSVFGFVAVAMLPVPFLFYVFSQRLRSNGLWSHSSP